MTQHRAILDFIGFPIHAPGNLECRLQLASFREDGSYIDDGSRPTMPSATQPMRNLHRLVIERGQNVRRRFEQVAKSIEDQGYDPPDFSMVRHVAQHEWRHSVIAARRERLHVKRPAHRIVVRALGFDLMSKGQLSVGLSRVIVKPSGPMVTAKSSVLLHPGDDIEALISAVNAVAELTDHEGLALEDQSLLRRVSSRLWTAEAIARREAEWARVDDHNSQLGVPPLATRQLEFLQRVDTLSTWLPVQNAAMAPAMQAYPQGALN